MPNTPHKDAWTPADPDDAPSHQEQQDALLERHAQEQLRLERIERMAQTMDAAFTIPGTSIPLGVDTLVGLVPGIGDTLSLGIAGYIASQGLSLGARKRHMTQMASNIFIDWLIGLVPVIGDLFDIGWRGNLRNAALLRRLTEKRWEEERLAAGIIDL
ncbi:DUF4112 domain-containing protein [Algimonas porphyrae]|uniref:DUF4112 domain-containing protein n=1 Tax=Algimonas porphyrae TaxID=1128113 RepID=A0ABQ5V0S2_9PROT|nr:DUF4112 domain-containing protein [Algimonas porphyrae]GLQ21153.1 hypothetical protein GCM10007854_21080 [Algimonas porphyrae]